MDEVSKHEHYYLKLTPKNEGKYSAGEMIALNNSRLDFGYFRGILIDTENKWIVLKFDPISYSTREENLNSAKEYLYEKGFDSERFDLEKIIEESTLDI